MPEPGQSVRSRSGAFAGVVRVEAVRDGPQGAIAVVELDDGALIKAPLPDLEVVRSLEGALLDGLIDPPGRWELRRLALEVATEQQRTGTVGALRITPLPHQVLAAHRVVDGSAGRVLLADDVGMGKTIEVGLILSALAARGEAKRALILCPASLRRQWQAELQDLFGQWFHLVGADGEVSASSRYVWSHYNRLIASIDLLRRKDHRQSLGEAPPWDVVVVDEAHRVAARWVGTGDRRGTRGKPRVERTQTYSLVELLSPRTHRLVFATATPHQGRDDQFAYLLRLLRPDLVTEGHLRDHRGLERLHPHLPELVVRTPKSLAVDWEGRAVFRGSVTRTIVVPVPEADDAFRSKLLAYIARGYATADAARSQRSSAVLINFVMTTFLKLWASSRAAIRQALVHRLERLRDGAARIARGQARDEVGGVDPADVGDGEEEEAALQRLAGAFFDDELGMVETLVAQLDRLGPDPKVTSLVETLGELGGEMEAQQTSAPAPLADGAESGPPGVLIFTEYRRSQDAIVDALRARFGEDEVVLIRGGQPHENLRAAARFQRPKSQGGARFLVSTQAGGEGLNLQYGGHVLVNFDQPWNPMRTLQRIGRLDRFGQRHRVVVINLMRDSAIDDRIMEKTWNKLTRVTEALAAAQGVNAEDLLGTVVGEFSERLDLPALLRATVGTDAEARAERLVDEALGDVRATVERARSLFAGLDAFTLVGEPEAFRPRPVGEAIRGVVEGVLEAHHRRLLLNEDGTWRFILPETWRGEPGMRREYPSVVFDATGAAAHLEAQPLGFGVPIFERVLGWARTEASPHRVTVAHAVGPRAATGVVAVVTGELNERRGGHTFRLVQTWTFSLTPDGEPLAWHEGTRWRQASSRPSPDTLARAMNHVKSESTKRIDAWVASRAKVLKDSTAADLRVDALAWLEVDTRWPPAPPTAT